MREVLVTGGAGYIGSHFVKAIKKRGYVPVVFDNLSKGNRQAVMGSELIFGDLRDADKLNTLFQTRNFYAVVHFAGSCYVGESVTNPHSYYGNNVANAWNLLHSMLKSKMNKIIFSSSCAVYGIPEVLPITESEKIKPLSPYGRSKMIFEMMLKDYHEAYGLNSISLRYFNAAGASEDGDIGECHNPETHLIPIVMEAALGLRRNVDIFGTDYNSPDGTCIRDYIHVSDLAEAHLLALDRLSDKGGAEFFNLGSEQGFSVREIIETVIRISGRKVMTEEKERRKGDPPVLVADSSKIKKELGWKPLQSSIDKIVQTAWNWHSSHPKGFRNG